CFEVSGIYGSANILTCTASIVISNSAQAPVGGRLIPNPALDTFRYSPTGGNEPSGTKNDLNHEGVRARRCQPPHDLQLAVQWKDRICANGRRLGPNLC